MILCEKVETGVWYVWQCDSDGVSQGVTGRFQVEVRLHQGSALRPSLFGIVMDR